MVACLATALAAGALVLAAAVDRGRRVEDLSALRGQGLTRAALRTATLWTYPVLVAVAVVVGTGIGLLGWSLTGWALPVAGIDPALVPAAGLAPARHRRPGRRRRAGRPGDRGRAGRPAHPARDPLTFAGPMWIAARCRRFGGGRRLIWGFRLSARRPWRA